MTELVDCPVSDSSAFRSALATPEEKLVIALLEPGQESELSALVGEARELRKNGVSVKILVYGHAGDCIPKDGGIEVLKAWALPLLSPILSVTDVVIPVSKESEDLLVSHRERGGRMPVVHRKAERLRDLFNNPAPQNARQLVLQNDWGIGDELLLSAVAREIVRSYPSTEVWIRSRHGFRYPSYVRRDLPGSHVRRIETIYQNATLYGPESHSPFPGHLVQQMLDKVALDTGLRVNAIDVRPELEISPIPKTSEPSVVLHTRTNPRFPSKDWGILRWEKLAGLLLASGIRLRQVGGPDEPLLQGVEDLRGRPVNELPEVFSESWAVVCVVGFLMHLAEAARTPAVVIYGGREHPSIDGYPDQIHLSSGPLPCRGRWGCHLGPDLECTHSMKCMDDITPELVAREVFWTLSRGERR